MLVDCCQGGTYSGAVLLVDLLFLLVTCPKVLRFCSSGAFASCNRFLWAWAFNWFQFIDFLGCVILLL